MKSVLFAAASTLLASVSATHEVVTKEASTFGATGEIVTHSFSGNKEAKEYIGDNLSNTKVTKWGEESIFGEKRKCILVSPGDACTYKITAGPKTGKLYWLRTSTKSCNNFNDYHTMSIDGTNTPNSAKSGGELLFDWIFGLVDDDESGTVDKGEVPDHVLDALDTNNDNKVDASDLGDVSAKVVFALFDEDGSGKISVNELPEYMIDIIEKSDDNNDNNDREITLEEFTTMFNKQMHPQEEL